MFRKEVIEAQRKAWLEDVRIDPPRTGWFYACLGLTAIAALTALLFFAQFQRRQKASGFLVPNTGLINIVPSSPGIVTKVLVSQGDEVTSGQPLVEISGASISAEQGDTQERINEQLQIRKSRLEEDSKKQAELSALRKENLESTAASLRDQIAQAKKQAKLQRERFESANATYEQWLKAENSGLVSRVQVSQQHESALQDMAEYEQLISQVLQLQQQLDDSQVQITQEPLSLDVKRNDITRELAQVNQEIAQNAAQNKIILRSTTAGTVANLLAHTGQTVSSNQLLLTLLPAGAFLRAELWVPTSSVGLLHSDESVLLRYRAFPYEKFGAHRGRVLSVSESAVSPEDLTKVAGGEISSPSYLIEVALDKQYVNAYGQDERLRAGMAVDADILLGSRRLIDWILDPLYGFNHKVQEAFSKTKEPLHA
ncbi:HlyD family efflux transporter periplasmic adaptor subunit [Dyella jejuensis]|uniref:HlyD family efflux transporter periplasmic adaptor subunit n=1 Tax=Dyella jejuensis TaxID=1432009 RepID=A0ABW8JDZ9_9GAMM